MSTITFDQVLDLAQQLSTRDQARLVVRLAPVLERALEQPLAKPRPDFWGVLSDLEPAPSAEEIDKARREVCANFPREDV